MLSPERAVAAVHEYWIKTGQAMDADHGYGFDLSPDRKKAWASIIRDQPRLVIGLPPCTFFVLFAGVEQADAQT